MLDKGISCHKYRDDVYGGLRPFDNRNPQGSSVAYCLGKPWQELYYSVQMLAGAAERWSPRTRMKYTKSISEHIRSQTDMCDEVDGIEFHRSVYNDSEDVISKENDEIKIVGS
ncbi:hypothetical protein EAG_09371 [Camponotus floridanus]|uniref:Uncharacterized protein n=1 Tax=Camponotus floridanus TaxID=104421 RepID=E2B0R0_CAMFO|nr:hypothetical protein EAG_09371 [Camponotus floridanus]